MGSSREALMAGISPASTPTQALKANATNIASAEAMIHALENGDLDWRDIVNPKA